MKILVKQKIEIEIDTIIIHGFSTGLSSKKIPKNDGHKKNHPVNLDKSFWTCPT
jgi:hypothetical protein